MEERKDCHGPYGPASPSHRAMRLFIRLTRLQRAVIGSRIKETGIYQAQHQILMHVHRHPDASQKDIAGMMEVSTATIAVSLKKLERAGYIRREVDEADNRYNRLQITEKGQQIIHQSHKILQQTEEEMFDGFAEEDHRRLEELLGRLLGNIEKMTEKDGGKICPGPFGGPGERPGRERPGWPEGPGRPGAPGRSEGASQPRRPDWPERPERSEDNGESEGSV